MTRFLNHDCKHKPWNKLTFDLYIAPKQNKYLILKEEQLNQLSATCAVILYHVQVIISFLDKYEHVTKKLACIVRCFLAFDFLKKYKYFAGDLTGLHLIEPNLFFIMLSDINYSKLIPAFQQLNLDLKQADLTKLLM